MLESSLWVHPFSWNRFLQCVCVEEGVVITHFLGTSLQQEAVVEQQQESGEMAQQTR